MGDSFNDIADDEAKYLRQVFGDRERFLSRMDQEIDAGTERLREALEGEDELAWIEGIDVEGLDFD